jgi:hypothetical protein
MTKKLKIAAIALIVAGALGLTYERFSYPETRQATLGSLTMTVQDTRTFHIPTWAAVGAMLAGVLALLWTKEYTPMKKS